MSSGEKEIFNVGKLQSKMKELDNLFSEFAEVLKNIDEKIADNVNVETGAFMGDVIGTKFLKLWENNSSSFNEFYDNFDSWSQLIYSIASTNSELEAEVESIYKGTMAKGSSIEEKMKFVAETGAVATGGLDSDKNPPVTSNTDADPKPEVLEGDEPAKTDQPVTETPATQTTVTLNSGDIIEREVIGENGEKTTMSDKFYAAYQRENGTLINIYEDESGFLYTLNDGKKEKLYYMDGNMNNPNAMIPFSKDSTFAFSSKDIFIGNDFTNDAARIGVPKDTFASSVEYADSSLVGGEVQTGGGPVCSKDMYNRTVSYSSDSLDKFQLPEDPTAEYSQTNGLDYYECDSMEAFGGRAYDSMNSGKDCIVRIDESHALQWDKGFWHPAHNFDNNGQPTYLRYSVKNNCYYECYDTGVIKDFEPYTLDGFNTNAGEFK